MKFVLLLSAILAVVGAEFVSYERYKVYELRPTNQEQLDVIVSFESNNHFDFWTTPIPRMLGLPTTVMVEPVAQNDFLLVLNKTKIPFKILSENVERNVQAERSRQNAAPKIPAGRITFTEYHSFETIQDYILELAQNYPDIVTIEIPQASFEGRPLRSVRIGTEGDNKPMILIEAGIHAREWISPAFALYLIQELVENEDNRALIENVDWFIIPVINPDGYEYTRTTERLWRKTRTPNWDSDCIGVDGNRNFPYQWMTIGASDDPCSNTFAGYAALNQFETMALRNVVEQYQIFGGERIKLFLSIHSYGQYILYPWGYTTDLPEDVELLESLAASVDDAIASVSGTRYTIGSTANVLYYASGSSPDWTKGSTGIDLSYTIELPGGGDFGFDLPASSILDVCVETFEGIRVFHEYVEDNFA